MGAEEALYSSTQNLRVYAIFVGNRFHRQDKCPFPSRVFKRRSSVQMCEIALTHFCEESVDDFPEGRVIPVGLLSEMSPYDFTVSSFSLRLFCKQYFPRFSAQGISRGIVLTQPDHLSFSHEAIERADQPFAIQADKPERSCQDIVTDFVRRNGTIAKEKVFFNNHFCRAVA